MRSQAQVIGRSKMKTWDDYEKGCCDTFGGGYQIEEEREIFRHGMKTVFTLLKKEFPMEPFQIFEAGPGSN